MIGREFTRRAAATICATALATIAASETLPYDIVVNGGSFSAVAAALSAARTNPSAHVLLVEPTDWVGGQATSQGVAAIDNSHHAPANTLMANDPALYYPADYLDFLDRLENAPAPAPGEGFGGFSGWVSRECYDPRTAVWVLDDMLAEQPNLTVMELAVIKTVATAPVTDEFGDALRIESLSLVERTPLPGYTPFDDVLSSELPDWYSTTDSLRFSKTTHTVVPRDAERGLVVVDASELGDAIVLSGAKYTQGREVSTETIAEDGTLPAINDDESMAAVFPFVMTGAASAASEADIKAPYPDFDAYLAQRTADYFSLGSFTWTDVWTYRRLYVGPGGSNSRFTINAADASMQNWNPGNDFRQANWLLDQAATNAQAAADWAGGADTANLAIAEKHAFAWYFWMKQRVPGSFPGADTRLARGADDLNMMGTKHGLAKFPYVRGTRRIVGLDNFRITGRYWTNTGGADYVGGTSFRYYDAVGIGNYASDVRPLLGSTGMVPPYSLPAPFYIPYRALGSHNVRNLLACGKLMAQTFVTNSGYRLHPIEWAGGSAAGVAAATMAQSGATNRELLSIPALRELQTTVAGNSPIRWAYTGEPVLPPRDGDLVVNGFATLVANTPFDVEAYHPSAVRAEIDIDGSPHAETTLRSNGRLLHQSSGAASANEEVLFEVRLFDESDALLETLSATVPFVPVPCGEDPTVTDNDNAALFGVTGSWTSAMAQGNRWCGGTYRYVFGTSAPGVATWQLRTPVSGHYEISVWYPESSNRASDSPFTVHHRDGQETIRIDQRFNGGRWIVLGTYPFTGGSGTVTLTNVGISDTSKLVVADAVRAVFKSPLANAADLWVMN